MLADDAFHLRVGLPLRLDVLDDRLDHQVAGGNRHRRSCPSAARAAPPWPRRSSCPWRRRLSRNVSMRASPLASASSFTSSTIVWNPDAAETCAIPPPINPHPSTPIVFIVTAPFPGPRSPVPIVEVQLYAASTIVRCPGRRRCRPRRRRSAPCGAGARGRA